MDGWHIRNRLFIIKGLKTCKSINISREIAFTITSNSLIRTMYSLWESRLKIGAKTLNILSHIRLVLSTLPWKLNQLLLSRPLLLAEYRITIKSVWSVKPVSRKLIFLVRDPLRLYRYFPENTANLFWDMVSINWYNLIKIVGPVFKIIAILFWGPSEGIWNVLIHRAQT
jgi:hypothetical protein